MQIHIARWGNSLALRIPRALADRLGLGAGGAVEEDRLAVRSTRRPIRLDELLARMTPCQRALTIRPTGRRRSSRARQSGAIWSGSISRHRPVTSLRGAVAARAGSRRRRPGRPSQKHRPARAANRGSRPSARECGDGGHAACRGFAGRLIAGIARRNHGELNSSRREAARERRLDCPQGLAVRRGDRVCRHRKCACCGAAGVEHLDVVAAAGGSRAVGVPAGPWIEGVGEAGPGLRRFAGELGVGGRNEGGVGGGQGVEDVGQLEAVAGVLQARLGEEGPASGRAVAAEDRGLGEQVGVDGLGLACSGDLVGGEEAAAAEDEVVDQGAERGGLGRAREPGRERAPVGRVVGLAAVDSESGDRRGGAGPEQLVQQRLEQCLSETAGSLVEQVGKQGALVAVDTDQVGLGFGPCARARRRILGRAGSGSGSCS